MVSAYKDEQIYTLNQRQLKTIQTSFCDAVLDADFNRCSLAASLPNPDALFEFNHTITELYHLLLLFLIDDLR